MTLKILGSLVALGLAGCAVPPPGTKAPVAVNDDPSLKPPVTITSFYGNTFTCRAGPGAFCIQR